MDQIEAETLNMMIGKEQSSTAHEKLFQNDEKAYLDLVRLNFNDILPFRTEGSLIGPKAPVDLEDARAYLKEEFKANITDDNRDTFEDALKMMESESGSQSLTPYAEYAQKNFDWARRCLWEQYGLVRLKQIRTFTIIHKEKYHKNRDDVGVNPVISVFHARYGAKALNPLKFYARRRYKVHLTCLLSLHSERRQRRAKGKITCWFSPYVIPLRRWGLIQESLF